MRRNRRRQFVVCVHNRDYPASLEIGKIYERFPDARADHHKLIRVADEEDQALYPSSYFLPIDLPKNIEDALEAAAELQPA